MTNYIYANSVKGQDVIRNLNAEGVLGKAATWASEMGGFDEWCERTNAFGFLVARHPDHEAAKTALATYFENVCSMEELARWVRRNIVFNATRHFMEPGIEEVYEYILNCGEYEENEARRLTNRVQEYCKADEKKRRGMRESFDQTILELLDGFHEKLAFYQANKAHMDELYELAGSIECDKYGI